MRAIYLWLNEAVGGSWPLGAIRLLAADEAEGRPRPLMATYYLPPLRPLRQITATEGDPPLANDEGKWGIMATECDLPLSVDEVESRLWFIGRSASDHR